MLKGINEGILIEITDFEKDKIELKERLSDKEFFKGPTDFILSKENKKYFPEIWKIVSRHNHNLYILKEVIKKEEPEEVCVEEIQEIKDEGEKTLIITKPMFKLNKKSDDKDGAIKSSNDGNVALRSGKKVEFNGNVVVIGDVNPGAEIIADGDIFIFGRAKGLLHAGRNGDKKRVILALSMEVNQIRIAGIYARSGEEKFKGRVSEIAFVDEENNLIVQEFKALG